MTYRIFVHTLPDDKIHKFEDLTAQQKATLEQNLIADRKGSIAAGRGKDCVSSLDRTSI